MSGDFLPKHQQPWLAETSLKISLFVCSECDSLSEEVEENEGLGTGETFMGDQFPSVKDSLCDA